MNSVAQKEKSPRSLENGNITIRNMLASIERTFLPVGSIIGKYRIIEEIDRGGMAVVYKALQLDLDREVALKVMPANITINRNFVERFLTEAHAVARLSHPNIVNIHEVATENNIYYLVMDYIPGKNLFYHLHFHKPKLVEVIEIIARLADALEYAHEQKIIHRDLKLNNVIMRDKLTPVLIDFGLAKAMENDEDGGITRTGEIMGSPSYMAPERLLGLKVDHRSDVCSLGIMLYEMLTFKNPYLDQRNLHQTTINVMEANPIPPQKLVPWLPIEIEAITLKAMAKDPLLRYQSMIELKNDIQRYQRGEPVTAKPPTLSSKIRRFTKKNWSMLAISGLVLLFLTLFGISFYIQNQKGQSHWLLFYNEKGSKVYQTEWYFSDQKPDGSTDIDFSNGVLSMRSAEMVYSRLQRRLHRDILIECEVYSDSGNLFNAGIFLFGDQPDSSFCFHINRWPKGLHGITMPRSSFMLQDAEPVEVPFSSVNHVVIERIQNSISFKINNVVVARIWDFLPPIGKGYDKMGFFVNNGAAQFGNLKIYRRATPQVPSPSIIADRFWERGDFESALDEYRGLLMDLNTNTAMACEINLKIADCLVRLNRYDEAMEIVRKKVFEKNRDESIIANKLFLEAIIYNMSKNEEASDSVLNALSTRYPTNPVNASAMLLALQRSVEHIEQDRPEIAKREILALIDQYKRYPHRWGKLYLKLLQYHIDKKNFGEAQKIAVMIIEKHDLGNNIVVNAKVALARIFLHQGKKERAKELLDQCVTGHSNNPGVWDAWMELADIYEYDFNYRDAITLYKKVARECPRSSIHPWMALVKTGELCMRDSDEVALEHFDAVVHSDNPFPTPKLIAGFYKNEISESYFKTKWQMLYPNDDTYLYYYAKKAAVADEQVVAGIYLNELKRKTTKISWRYFKLMKIINNLQIW